MAGFAFATGARVAAMLVMAIAAWYSTVRLIRFSPARSVTAGIRIRSDMPTLGGGIARGHGGDDQFRQPVRQIAQAGGQDRGAATAADADHPGDIGAAGDEAGEGQPHGRDRRSAVIEPQYRRGAIGVVRSHHSSRNIDRQGGGAGADIDQADRTVALTQQHGQKGQLLPLGIGRACQIEPLHRVTFGLEYGIIGRSGGAAT